jgi:hypothetical protein
MNADTGMLLADEHFGDIAFGERRQCLSETILIDVAAGMFGQLRFDFEDQCLEFSIRDSLDVPAFRHNRVLELRQRNLAEDVFGKLGSKLWGG